MSRNKVGNCRGWERLFRPHNQMLLSEAQKFVHRNYYNVVSYIHIPLVP